MITGPLAFASRIAQETLGLKTVTVQLAPAVFASCHAPPRLPHTFMPWWLPRGLIRAQWWLLDRVVDGMFTEMNAFRRGLGLDPVGRVMYDWVHSPLLVLALFPQWYASPAPDWPAQVRLTGFPLYDRSAHAALPETARRVFDQDHPPVVFTPGSAMLHAKRTFFEAAVVACRRLNRQGVFLTPYTAQLPPLPEGIHHFDYLPLSQVLPRAAALVYHGGIGTASQACAAGTPHVVVPYAYDQLDNAARIRALGLGHEVPANHLRPKRMTHAIELATSDPGLKSRCKTFATRCAEMNPFAESCDILEAL